MKTAEKIHYMVRRTPMKPGDTEQTYHARQVMNTTVRTRTLAEHVAEHTLIKAGLLEMVLDELRNEMVEYLLGGHDLHLDGIGHFSLQLGTVKTKDKNGHWRTKTYTSPDQLTAREITIDGISFVPDKKMMEMLRSKERLFTRVKGDYEHDIPRAKLLTTLNDYCQKNGSFTRHEFQSLFGVSRYHAKKVLDALVAEPFPKYYRTKYGPTYIYRKTGT